MRWLVVRVVLFAAAYGGTFLALIPSWLLAGRGGVDAASLLAPSSNEISVMHFGRLGGGEGWRLCPCSTSCGFRT